MARSQQASTPVDLNTPHAAAVLMGAMAELAQLWELKNDQLLTLLGLSRTTFYRFKNGEATVGLDLATRERVSYLLRIQAALELLLPNEQADRWVKKPNTAPLFGGASALDRMLGGQVGDLMVVADYLDAQRGGDFL